MNSEEPAASVLPLRLDSFVRIAILAQPESWYFRDLSRAASARGHTAVRWDFPAWSARVQTGGETGQLGDAPTSDIDALIVRTMPPGSLEQVISRMNWLARLEAAGLPVLNGPKALECAVDKYLTTARLAAAGLPVPDTIVCESYERANTALVELGGDVVVKPLFGSEGRGILRISDPDLGARVFTTLSRMQAVLYLQRFIDHGGSDIRILVLDGEVLGGMRRISPHDFRTNVARQAIAEAHNPTEQERAWAWAAVQATGAVFAGVDVLYDRDGQGYVIEVNAVPGWQAFASVNQLDVADRCIAWLEHRVRFSAQASRTI